MRIYPATISYGNDKAEIEVRAGSLREAIIQARNRGVKQFPSFNEADDLPAGIKVHVGIPREEI